MNPFLLAAGAQGIGKLLFGFGQKNKADDLKPFDYIPEATLENKRLAEQQSSTSQYAGQMQDETNVDRATAASVGNTTRNAKSATDILNANATAQARANNAGQQIGQRLQQWKAQGLNRLGQANKDIAGYQYKNQQDFWNTKAQLTNAGNTNIFSGLGDVLTGGAGAYDGIKNQGKYSNPNPWGGGFPFYGQWNQNSGLV